MQERITNLETRKIKIIKEILRLNNLEAIEKLENILFEEMKKKIGKEPLPMIVEELNALIDLAESNSLNNRIFDAQEILQDIDKWK